MTAAAVILALAFGLGCGALFAWARVCPPRRRALLTGAAAVCLIQALTLGVMGTYSSLQSAGYLAAVVIVGLVLTGVLVLVALRQE